ncbi:MAG: phage terminase large subunit family protein [Desulfovibrio sp.]
MLNSLTNLEAIRGMVQRGFEALKPPLKLSISEWADKFRIIGAANAHPGPWRTDLVPYQREPMECMCDDVTSIISLMWAAQVGKTEIENNAIGYFIAHDPQSIMVMHPTETDLKTWEATKLQPMFDDTPEVGGVVAKPRGREGVNNQNMKSFPGGFLLFSWSGSPNTMRGRSAPKIICDEIDGYSMNNEGDPVNLIWQRAATFGSQRKRIESSTPTIKKYSRIENSFEAGDKRRYFVPCPHCDGMQTLKWPNVKWDRDADGGHLPETAHYICEFCGAVITDKDKPAMLRAGEWRAEKPFRGHASFHLNELYSPFRRFQDIAESFLEKRASNDMQSFVNVSLAETWEEKGETVDSTGLMERREEYAAEVPAKGIVVVMGVDTQQDRLECEVVAFGHGEESWSVDYQVFYGDPDKPEVWEALDDYRGKRWQHESGVKLSLLATCIDSGGSNTQAVYAYCKKRKLERVFAIKGKGGDGIPIVGSPTKRKIGKRSGRAVDLFSIGVDQAKTLIYKRLAQKGSGSGCCHFPMHYDDGYFNMLTAEKCITRYVKGFPKREWVKIRPRNEALDCRVYAYAAFLIMGPNLKRIEKRSNMRAESVEEMPKNVVDEPKPEPVAEETPPQKTYKKKRKRRKRRKINSFVKGW